MKNKTLQIQFTTFQSVDELDKTDLLLIEKSKEAMIRAYAPYSKFCVGAALLLDDGTIVEGNNQENAAYPSGLCAERVALFYAGAQHPDKHVQKIAITAKKCITNQKLPIVFPCGACRQVLVETEVRQQQPISIILFNEEGKGVIFEGINNLMPFAFDISKILQDD